MSREIPVSKGQIAIVDDDWYGLLTKWKWGCFGKLGGNKPIYAARRETVTPGNSRLLLMHYQILPRIAGLQVDHINGNGLDNRMENLRYCTTHENNCNTKRHKDGESRHKGVTRGKVVGTWRAN